jgi:hypothetical protein
MRRLRIAARSFGAALLLVTAWCVSPAMAAKLENTFYAASTTLFFKVSDAALASCSPPDGNSPPCRRCKGAI